MKTREFIKMLQEADPSGEAHIRMEDGVPIYAMLLPGYYDGWYSYLDDGNFVISRSNTKLDIHCVDLENFVENEFDLNEVDNWENIKSKFKFENIDSSRSESIIRIAKERWDEEYKYEKKDFEENIVRNVENAKNGWTWFQNKLIDDDSLMPNIHHYYTWKIYDKDGKEQSSNINNTHGVYKSDLFEKLDNDVKSGYYQWILK